jgi:hypothetical protein
VELAAKQLDIAVPSASTLNGAGIIQVNPVGNFSLQVFATDLYRNGIEKTRTGIYPANIAARMSPLNDKKRNLKTLLYSTR